ncbi:MAG: hypothetical protein B9S33_04980, partial [Pedosphaera sp. Tous-C6FEB]
MRLVADFFGIARATGGGCKLSAQAPASTIALRVARGFIVLTHRSKRQRTGALQDAGALLLTGLVMSFASLAAGQDTFPTRVQPLLKTYCVECHAGAKPKAGVQLAGSRTADQLAAERDHWFRVLDALEAGTMPPKDEKQPTPAERAALVAWLRGDFTNTLLAQQRAEGRSKLRRLSRTEYANTIFDLFGVKPAVGLNLPTDGRVDGYDKVAAALPLSASGAAGYFKMADDILARMLRPIPKTPPKPRVAKKAATTDFDDVLGDKKPEPSAGGLQPPSGASPFDPARTVRAIAFGSEQSKGHILELPDGTKVSFNTDTTSGPLRGFGGPRNPGVHRLRLSVYAYQT